MKFVRIPLGVKIFGIALSLLGLLVLIAYSSHQQLRQVGREVYDLAEHILPITNAVNEVAVTALEQGVLVERILRLYELDPPDKDATQTEWERFEAHNGRVEAELSTSIVKIRTALNAALSAASRDELRKIEPMLERVGREHQDYHDHALKIFARLEQGERGNTTRQLEGKLSDEADQLNKELNLLRAELDGYMVRAADNRRLSDMRTFLEHLLEIERIDVR